MKSAKILFNIATVISFIFGALYIFSLVFIPVGVYCFIAARRFQHKADHLYDSYALSNDTLKNWVIFISIACFPFGLIAIIPYWLVVSNNIKVSSTENNNQTEVEIVDEIEKNQEEKEVEQVEVHQEETLEEKQAKFEKLKNFHEKGIITDDELEMAREQLFGKIED